MLTYLRQESLVMVIKEHNYTAFECDPDSGTIRVAFIADDGSVIGLSTIAF